jgi:hypothetical protein
VLLGALRSNAPLLIFVKKFCGDFDVNLKAVIFDLDEAMIANLKVCNPFESERREDFWLDGPAVQAKNRLFLYRVSSLIIALKFCVPASFGIDRYCGTTHRFIQSVLTPAIEIFGSRCRNT